MKNQRHPLLWLSIGFIICISLWVIIHRLFPPPGAAINRNEVRLSNVVPNDFRIAEINPGLSPDQVKRRLGVPHRQRSEKTSSYQNPSYISYQNRWFYPGLEIWFLASAAKNSPPPRDGQVIKIIVTSSGYKTFRAIGVGDDFHDVVKQYGRAPVSNAGMNYYSDLGDISFTIDRSRVSRIEIDANMD